MPLSHTILFAADFSDVSRDAFQLACALAHERKTRMIVLHVVQLPHVEVQPVGMGEFVAPESETDAILADRDLIEQRLRDSYVPNHAVDVSYVAAGGRPPDEILRRASEIDAGLIVMGTHGRTGLKRLLAGSVAEAVLRGATRPVLAFRAAEVLSPIREVPVVLVASDFSHDSNAALPVARGLARDRGARLVVFHVEPSEIRDPSTVSMPDAPPDARERLEAARAACEGPDLKYPVVSKIARGAAAPEIVKAAEEVGAGLIVVGTHGRGGLHRALMGSVAEGVMRKAKSPVLVVRNGSPWSASRPGAQSASNLTVH